MALVDTKSPLVVHVVYRFDTGGLENGVVNLINHMPDNAYRHVVLSLTEITDFRHRITRKDVQFISLNKSPGHAFRLYPKLFKLLRRLRPDIVHTRNLAALEVVVAAWCARVHVRIHGEHGRDVGDLDGSNRKFQWMRRFYSPFVSQYVALSRDLSQYLSDKINISPTRITQVYNGVDIVLFSPSPPGVDGVAAGCPFGEPSLWIVGTVGRMQTVKDQLTLTLAFVRALEMEPSLRSRMRLVLVGDGELREQCQAVLDAGEVAHLAWLPGERSDIPEIMRSLDCFVLPSLAEGISNTILEAMASGLPVIATDVGGNADLVVHGVTGLIVPASDAEEMAQGLLHLAAEPALARSMGLAGRLRVLEKFSLQAMVDTYKGLYDRLLRPALGNLRLPPKTR